LPFLLVIPEGDLTFVEAAYKPSARRLLRFDLDGYFPE